MQRAHDLPFEYIEITSVWLRGKLGPISIWSTPGGFRGKQENESEWQKNYEKTHGPSLALAEMKLSLPIRLAPNECNILILPTSLTPHAHTLTISSQICLYTDATRSAADRTNTCSF